MAVVKPLPEKRIEDVGGSKIEYVMAGEGEPAIVLLTGYGADIDLSWRKILTEVQTISTVFAYNRFNYGNSDRSEVSQTGLEVVSSLRSLLAKRKVNPPYVLVAHSIGGVYAQLFARLHPEEIAGVVLVDSSHPDQEEMRKVRETLIRCAIVGAIHWLDSVAHPRRHTELASFSEMASQIRTAPPFPDVPLIVISAGKEPPSWLVGDAFSQIFKENKRSLVTLSPLGKQIIATRSGHFIQNDEPEIVVQAIRELVGKGSRKRNS